MLEVPISNFSQVTNCPILKIAKWRLWCQCSLFHQKNNRGFLPVIIIMKWAVLLFIPTEDPVIIYLSSFTEM